MKLMYTTIVIAALVATCCAFPYTEESWHAEDDLLARVFDDSSPLSELIQLGNKPSTSAPSTSPSAPTKAPTKAPTYHPCRDGSHDCDKGPCGVCNEVGDSWECGRRSSCDAPVTSPPVTSPPVTSPPITSPPSTSPPSTTQPLTSSQIAGEKSKNLAAEAIKAKKTYEEEKTIEEESTKEAKKLLKAADKLKVKATKKLDGQKEDLAAAEKSANEQSQAASKATKEADEKSEAVQKEYKDEKAAIAADGVKATREAKARLAATKKAAKAAAKAVKAEEEKQTAITKARRTTVSTLEAARNDASNVYKAKMEVLEKEKKKSEADFSIEAKKITAADLKRLKANKNQADAEKKVLQDEVEANKRTQQILKEKIAKDAKEAQDALAKVNTDKDNLAKDAKEAEKARRGNAKDMKETKEAASKVTFKKDSAKAEQEEAKANTAEQEFEDSEAQSESEQKEEDEKEDNENEEDDDMAECASDGSECMSCVKNGDKHKCECEKVGDDGPFIGADFYSCSNTKADSGEGWGNILDPLPKTPLMAADQEKCDKLKDDATGIFKDALASNNFPLEVIACHNSTTFHDKTIAINKFFDRAAVCKPFCFKNTETYTDDDIADTNGICIGLDDIKGLKMQIDNTIADYNTLSDPDLCKITHNIVCGFTAGRGLQECAPVDTSVPHPHLDGEYAHGGVGYGELIQ